MTVLVDNQMPLLISLLKPYVNVMPFEGRTTSEAGTAALRKLILANNAQALIVRSTTIVNAMLLHATSVRFVATATAGVDHVDTDYLDAQNIAFASAPGCNANAVADYVMLAIEVWQNHIHVGSQPTSVTTLGIVGFGNVGRRLAHHARSTGMRVLVYDPPLMESTSMEDVDGAISDLRSLITSSDIISLHVPLTRAGRHATANMIDAKHIAAMNKGTLFINTSRGGIVDEDVLKQRLETQEITSVLDVFSNEPSIDIGLALLSLVSTPHVAGYTLEAKANAARLAGAALLQWLGLRTTAFHDAAIEVPNPSSSIRNLVADTLQMREALSNISSIDAFDLLRKNYALKHEHLRDPY